MTEVSVIDPNIEVVSSTLNGVERWVVKGTEVSNDRGEITSGLLHREDGPAVYNPETGEEEWHRLGRLFRLEGPARIDRHGNKFWFVNGRLHREDGPAIEYADGTGEYWVAGKTISKDNYEFLVHQFETKGRVATEEYVGSDGVRVKVWQDLYSVQYRTVDTDELHRADDQPALHSDIFLNGPTRIWAKQGLRHREGKPAYISPLGEMYYQEGKLHREGGEPASVMSLAEGGIEKRWVINGQLHREDGPAIEVGTQEELRVGITRNTDGSEVGGESLGHHWKPTHTEYYLHGREVAESAFKETEEEGLSWGALGGALAIAGLTTLLSGKSVKNQKVVKEREHEQVSH